jgi:hypothetical protein
MRRPSLTKKTAESLSVGAEALRAMLATTTDEERRGHIIRSVDYLNHSVEYRRWLDRAGPKG